MNIYELAANTLGIRTGELSEDLKEILNKVDNNVKKANLNRFGAQLRSSQVVALIIFLWESGIIK